MKEPQENPWLETLKELDREKNPEKVGWTV